MTTPKRVRWWAPVVLTVFLSVTASLHAGILPILQKIDCANGFKEAFIIITVDTEYGCVLSISGRGCDGVVWHVWNNSIGVLTNPDLPFTCHFEGIADNGAMWFANVQIEDGHMTGLWGRNARGEYYVSEPASIQ